MKYVGFDTQSDPESETYPSTAKQLILLNYLAEEMKELGLEDVEVDANGYAMGTIPATPGYEDRPVIGFISHVDTSPDMSGKNVTPRIVEKYDGSDIVLCAEENIVLSPSQFPELLDHKGEDLIVTTGKTLLGADDKAGIAEIVSAVVYLQEHPDVADRIEQEVRENMWKLQGSRAKPPIAPASKAVNVSADDFNDET